MKRPTFTWLDLKAVSKPHHCPICELVNMRTNQKIDTFQYAHIADVGFRKDFIDSDGFCQYHTEKFYDAGDHINHAILYHHLLTVKLNRINQQKPAKKKKPSPCLLCAHEKTSEALYINLFASGLDQKEFKDIYMHNGIVCLHHFDPILKRLRKIKSTHLDDFLKRTLSAYEVYQHDLAEIKRKNDHKHSDERLNDSERRTWKLIRKLLIDQGSHRR